MTIAIDDAGAAYPVLVDPTIAPVATLAAQGGAVGDAFGRSVAILGTTIVVGAPSHDGGERAVYALKLKQAEIDVASPPRQPDIPFAVLVTIRAPLSNRPTLGRLVKGIFDGVVSAFQAHGNTSGAAELAALVSRTLQTDLADIQTLLVGQRQAALGTQPRLLHRRGDGVQWSPADDLCVAGELLAEAPPVSTWAIKGKIVELEPA